MSYIEEILTLGRDANPFFRLMEIELGPLGKEVAELSMQVRPDMLNGVGWLQGGLFTALCDEAMALALFTVLDEGEGIATISRAPASCRASGRAGSKPWEGWLREAEVSLFWKAL